jgi:hypothetical protein
MPIDIKGGVITGEEARAKITDEILTKSDLTKSELTFILSKLKSATYIGSEFETFYAVWVKLSTLVESK